MKTRIYNIWYSIHGSYWFVPSLLTVASILFAYLTLRMDRWATATRAFEDNWWVRSLGAEGSRQILSSIATSMITVAGVSFSVIIVAFSLASTQFGPRILAQFMRDTGNQFVLGTFIGTFIYCLITMGFVRGEDPNIFVPHISVACGLLLAMTSLGVLIYFIHHASMSIQVPQIVSAIARDLDRTIGRVCQDSADQCRPAHLQGGPVPADIPEDFTAQACPVTSHCDGYLQAIEVRTLLDLASRSDLVVRMEYRPGHFVIAGTPLVHAWPPGRIDAKTAKRIRNTFLIGNHRTYEQDIEFAIHQLVEIALRALSAALNDPITANMCLDRLGAALCRLTQASIPPLYHFDAEGRTRLIDYPETFEGILDAAFDMIRQNAADKPAVVIHMLRVIRTIIPRARGLHQREALRKHIHMIRRDALSAIDEESDRHDIEHASQQALRELDHPEEELERAA